jgi:hypothetical protein
MNQASHEFKLVLLSADSGHGITYKRNIIPILGGEGGTYDNRIDMDAVDNDARCETFVSKGQANDTGFAGAQGGHCIEEVCNTTKPLVNGSYQAVGACLAMTD